jgi:hypothetical protein
MILSAIIENDIENELLVCVTEDSQGNGVISLPSVYAENSESVDQLINKCKKEYDVDFEIVNQPKVYKNSDLMVYETKIRSFSYSTNNKLYKWIGTDNLCLSIVEKEYIDVFSDLINEYKVLKSIRELIRDKVNAVTELFSELFTIEISEQKEGINIFIHYSEKIICPFGFRVDFKILNDKIMLLYSMFLTRSYADGDKTDEYFLFANLMSIIQKVLFNEDVYIEYLSLFDNREINRASLLFLDNHSLIDLNDNTTLGEYTESHYCSFVMSLMFFGDIFGSFSNELDENKFNEQYSNYLCKDGDMWNCQSRKESQFYIDLHRGLALLHLDNLEYDSDMLLHIKTEMIDCENGKVLCQNLTENGYQSHRFITKERWTIAEILISDMKIEKYSFVCQNDSLYLIENNNIWVFIGDYSKYKAEDEKKNIINRHNRERMALNLNRNFSWKYPVNYSRFEELIADLMDREERILSVRLMGKSNASDGGRDLLIWKTKKKNENTFGSVLILGQCKAYIHSVGKRDVTDIRDKIENYDAKGFHLFVSSELTPQLIDNLVKLQEKYEIDWWTQREIFQRLRLNSDIADRYLDIINIDNNCEGDEVE